MNNLLENNLESNELNTNIEETSDINLISNSENSNNTEIANSLALTIKKDYSLTIAKNIFIKTLRSTWKIVLSVFTLNFLKFFL